MFEKVNPSHPDKVADRIAGALVDYAYRKEENPKIAVEVLIGHGVCHIIAETSVHIPFGIVHGIVVRICGFETIKTDYNEVPQDSILAGNQEDGIRCGDNGIFLGCPVTAEERFLTKFVGDMYNKFKTDGKFIYNAAENKMTICQSCADKVELENAVYDCIRKQRATNPFVTINPLGEWTGGIGVDTGATNRKLGSDMGGSITGGGLHGKDLSKADVTLNIFTFLKAQEDEFEKRVCCSIGDEKINGASYGYIVEIAREYINSIGGFEKFAEWGLIRP